MVMDMVVDMVVDMEVDMEVDMVVDMEVVLEVDIEVNKDVDSVLTWRPRCPLTLRLLPLSVASIPLPLLSLSLLPLSQLPLQPLHSFPLPPDLLLQPPQVGVVLQVWHCACFFEEQVLSVDETVVSLDMVGDFIAASCNQILVEIFPQAFQAKAGYSDLSHFERVDIISTPAHVY